jgi:hypothetical protein
MCAPIGIAVRILYVHVALETDLLVYFFRLLLNGCHGRLIEAMMKTIGASLARIVFAEWLSYALIL